jgi:hypothetical protein
MGEKKKTEMWKNGSWILHHINALSVKMFLEKQKVPVLEHPLYSPDLALCYFFLFPETKSALKGTCFLFCRCSGGKSNRGNEEAIRIGPEAFASNCG